MVSTGLASTFFETWTSWILRKAADRQQMVRCHPDNVNKSTAPHSLLSTFSRVPSQTKVIITRPNGLQGLPMAHCDAFITRTSRRMRAKEDDECRFSLLVLSPPLGRPCGDGPR